MKIASQPSVKQKSRVEQSYKNGTDHSDEELVNQIVKRDPQGLKLLFAKYWDELFEVTYRRVFSKNDANAIVVEVFEIIWKNCKGLGNYPARTYLYLTLKRQIFLYYERHPLLLKKIIATTTIDAN